MSSPRRGLAVIALAACLAAALATSVVQAQPAATAAAHGRPKVCLVLAGGGAKGIAHIGVLKVLTEMRVPIDCVVGTSVGAIVGGAYASGYDADRIEAIVRAADWSRLLSDQPDRAQRSVYAKAVERAHAGTAELGLAGSNLKLPKGVLVGQQLQPFLRALVPAGPDLRFDDLPIPFRAVATDFVTGRIAVLDQGDLALAIRASMSVPGVFAPVEIGDALLVDGGLVRNLPVDIARRFHPDVIIAVDLGTALLKREDIGSLLTVGLQTINILVAQNDERSLHDLTDADILVSPVVDDVDSGDFAHSVRAIERGETAARAIAARLAALSVSPAEYSAWERTHDRPPQPPRYAAVTIDTSGLKRTNPKSVEARFAAQPADATLQQRFDDLLGTDDFEHIDAHSEPGPEGMKLVLKPVEKSWGPDYLRLGLSMDADLAGGSDVTVFADYRSTWLTPSGLELRMHGSLGRIDDISAELRQPLDATRRWFADASFSAFNAQHDVYAEEYPVASYRETAFGGGGEVGRYFGNLGEAAIGVRADSTALSYNTGIPLHAYDVGRQTDPVLTARFVSDSLDSLDFPQQGHLLRADAELARHVDGTRFDYTRYSLAASQAFGAGSTSGFLTLRWQGSAGTPLPLYRDFTLGGFLNLSGLRNDQILAERVLYVRGVLRQRVASAGSLLPGLYVGASLEGADVRDRANVFGPLLAELSPAGNLRIGGGSVFLSAESALGPFYLAVGRSRAGQTSVYLYVGRP